MAHLGGAFALPPPAPLPHSGDGAFVLVAPALLPWYCFGHFVRYHSCGLNPSLGSYW